MRTPVTIVGHAVRARCRGAYGRSLRRAAAHDGLALRRFRTAEQLRAARRLLRVLRLVGGGGTVLLLQRSRGSYARGAAGSLIKHPESRLLARAGTLAARTREAARVERVVRRRHGAVHGQRARARAAPADLTRRPLANAAVECSRARVRIICAFDCGGWCARSACRRADSQLVVAQFTGALRALPRTRSSALPRPFAYSPGPATHPSPLARDQLA